MLQIGDAGSFICLDFRLIGALTFGFFCMLALKCARQGAVVGKPKRSSVLAARTGFASRYYPGRS
jgi:hypothetical protein